MNTLNVVNIKCGGCENKIKKSMEKAGISNVLIDVKRQEVSFDGDTNIARHILANLGYPESGSKEAKSILKKGYSYVSCVLGRMMK